MALNEYDAQIVEQAMKPILDSNLFSRKIFQKKKIPEDVEVYNLVQVVFDENAFKKGSMELTEVPIKTTTSPFTVFDINLKVTKARRFVEGPNADYNKAQIFEGLAKVVARAENQYSIDALSKNNTAVGASASWNGADTTPDKIANDIIDAKTKIEQYSNAKCALVAPVDAIACFRKIGTQGFSAYDETKDFIKEIIPTNLITDKSAYLVPIDIAILQMGVAVEADQFIEKKATQVEFIFTEAISPMVKEKNGIIKIQKVLG
ncbi:hypothetical protein [Methanocaldococcus jannaschii]|nr:hypothetical protein [Methanocaldococcus jannaschii]